MTEGYEVALFVTAPLQIVHNAPLFRRIATVFSVTGETERAALAELVGDAFQGAQQALRELTSDALEAVLARRTTTALKLELAAPRILLPEDLADPKANILVFDLGAISLNSTTAPAAAAEAAAGAGTGAGGSGGAAPAPS